MNSELNFEGVMSSNWNNVEYIECADGITERVLWEGDNGKRAMVYEFSPGAVFPGVDVHESGPEQVYVISGVFNDGREDFPAGSFIHNPMGSAHAPKSESGCVLLVLYPEG
ncbi:MAG: anti-sigma factor [Gammaproteobacteria bacterium]|nr:MAG: anti-sigma factor [Gammaproteobacteria bacterium]RKZ81412.1 MAG: anti-sigma factor [Gammaproteobacteria bacterium]